MATLVDWFFYEVKQQRSWLVPGWVTAVLDFIEDLVSRYNTVFVVARFSSLTLVPLNPDRYYF